MNTIDDFDYDLPENLIALNPIRPRSDSKLLVFAEKEIIDSNFFDLARYLNENDRLIFNDTKVIRAKLTGKRLRDSNLGLSEAKVEVLLSEQMSGNSWKALCKPLKRIKVGDVIVFGSSLSAKVDYKTRFDCKLKFSKSGASLNREIVQFGELPLPPYIIKRRKYLSSDFDDYQTIFATNIGAIASPTASLHFDRKLMRALDVAKIPRSFVTLHVGSGTFMPVKTTNISDHVMHPERGILPQSVANDINQTIQAGGRIIAVGTTSLRLIESATSEDGLVNKFDGKTEIFIKPGYSFRSVSGLITNFHFPKSTLLMLVSAFVGNEDRKRIYQHAIANHYRFYSYGDGSLLLPNI